MSREAATTHRGSGRPVLSWTPVPWPVWLGAGIVVGLLLGFAFGLAKPRPRS